MVHLKVVSGLVLKLDKENASDDYGWRMAEQIYIIYTKLADTAYRTLAIKASGYTITVEKEGQQVKFSDNGKTVAVFNMAELVGFVQQDHVVN